TSFAWINSTYAKQPLAYFALNRLGIEAWQQLCAEIGPELPVRWGGSVEWYGDAKNADALRGNVRHHQAWGYPTHIIDDAALRGLGPPVTRGSIAAGAYAETEAAADPGGAAEVILERAKKAGARVTFPAEVMGLDQREGRLRAVRTTAGDVEADVLVVACG